MAHNYSVITWNFLSEKILHFINVTGLIMKIIEKETQFYNFIE